VFKEAVLCEQPFLLDEWQLAGGDLQLMAAGWGVMGNFVGIVSI